MVEERAMNPLETILAAVFESDEASGAVRGAAQEVRQAERDFNKSIAYSKRTDTPLAAGAHRSFEDDLVALEESNEALEAALRDYLDAPCASREKRVLEAANTAVQLRRRWIAG
jgi:hypothetical protein